MTFNFEVNQHLFLASATGDFITACKGDARDVAQASHGPVDTYFTNTLTTNSISGALPRNSALAPLKRLARIRKCNSINFGFGEESHRCCNATVDDWNLPIV